MVLTAFSVVTTKSLPPLKAEPKKVKKMSKVN